MNDKDNEDNDDDDGGFSVLTFADYYIEGEKRIFYIHYVNKIHHVLHRVQRLFIYARTLC